MVQFRTQGIILKKVVESLNELVTNVNINCSIDGLSVQAIDSSSTALVALLLRAGGFDLYKFTRSMCMGVNIPQMVRVLKLADNDDIITTNVDDVDNTVTFYFERPHTGQNEKREYIMSLMDIDAECMDLPEMAYHAVVRMSSTKFAKICRDLTSFGDTVVISVTKEGIKFSSGNEIENANIFCRGNNSIPKTEEATSIQMNEPILMTFRLKSINSFTKATPLSNTVKISLYPDYPIVVEYEIPKKGYIKFFLTPKEEDEFA